eukprot:12418660-Karenia_brevis.AAC.1
MLSQVGAAFESSEELCNSLGVHMSPRIHEFWSIADKVSQGKSETMARCSTAVKQLNRVHASPMKRPRHAMPLQSVAIDAQVRPEMGRRMDPSVKPSAKLWQIMLSIGHHSTTYGEWGDLKGADLHLYKEAFCR